MDNDLIERLRAAQGAGVGSASLFNLIDEAAAALEAAREEVSGLRAARIAYANEFPLTEDGEPDTGNVHANIRALKARAERLAAAVEDAPVGRLDIGRNDCDAADMVEIVIDPNRVSHLQYQRVRVLPTMAAEGRE